MRCRAAPARIGPGGLSDILDWWSDRTEESREAARDSRTGLGGHGRWPVMVAAVLATLGIILSGIVLIRPAYEARSPVPAVRTAEPPGP